MSDSPRSEERSRSRSRSRDDEDNRRRVHEDANHENHEAHDGENFSLYITNLSFEVILS